jgi:serine/threonine protein kinase
MTFLVDEVRVLGLGAFGDAVLCTHKETKMECVIKRIPKLLGDSGAADKIPAQFWKQEVKAMGAVSSNYIVPIFDAFEDENYIYIAMEYCRKGNLRGFLLSLEVERQFLSEEVCTCFLVYVTMWVVAEGLGNAEPSCCWIARYACCGFGAS